MKWLAAQMARGAMKLVARIERAFCSAPGSVAITFSLACAVLLTFPLFLIPQRPPYVSITAITETLQYRVTRPELAVIPIVDGRFLELDQGCGWNGTILGLLKPKLETEVRYRLSNNRLSIQLSGKQDISATFEHQDGKQCELPQDVTITMPRPREESIASSPLPIVGPAEIGVISRQSRRPTTRNSRRIFGTMYSGEVRVFGRTSWGVLYPAQVDAITLPAGGKLSSLNDDAENLEQDALSAWHGVAIVGDKALTVSATTESNALRLQRPGNQTDTETFRVSHFSRLINDPAMALPTLFLAVLSLAMQTIAGWMSIWKMLR